MQYIRGAVQCPEGLCGNALTWKKTPYVGQGKCMPCLKDRVLLN